MVSLNSSTSAALYVKNRRRMDRGGKSIPSSRLGPGWERCENNDCAMSWYRSLRRYEKPTTAKIRIVTTRYWLASQVEGGHWRAVAMEGLYVMNAGLK